MHIQINLVVDMVVHILLWSIDKGSSGNLNKNVFVFFFPGILSLFLYIKQKDIVKNNYCDDDDDDDELILWYGWPTKGV